MSDLQDVKIWTGSAWESLEGPQGENGTSATVDVGTTTTSAPGGDAAVENVGTTTKAEFNFTIPRGETGGQGNSGTQQVGKVDTTTSNPGGNAAVQIANSGTQSAAIYDYSFTIPKGAKGDTGTGVSIIGSIDVVGPPDAGFYPNITQGDVVIDSNGDGWLWDDEQFVNVGAIRGPEGPEGDAATVSATATGNQVGSDQPATASVINNGTTSAAQFAFSFDLPQGVAGGKGDAGKDGENAEVYAQTNQPVAKAVGALWLVLG